MKLTKYSIDKDILAFYFSLIVLIYFGLLVINAELWHLNFTLIGVFQELLTVPIMVVQFILFVYLGYKIVKDRNRANTYLISATLILLLVNVFIITSFSLMI